MKHTPSAVPLAALALAACAHGSLAPDVVFTRYSPLSRSLEIARRTLAPRTFRRVEQALAAKGQKLPEQDIDLRQERFTGSAASS